MIKPEYSNPGAGGPAAAPLFETLAFPGDAYGEAFESAAGPREHWQALITALSGIGPEVLQQRQERARRMRHEDGATFNPFDAPTGRGTPWALDLIPLIITEKEWTGIEAGLIQRAGLLERILADTYGPQTLLKDGWLPPELVFANPNFHHTCHGIQPAGDRFLTYYAADLYRAPDGRMRVLRDYSANPAGLGYALENRIVISRVFPQLYPKAQIRRLAPFFHTFHRSLVQRTPLENEEPGIVLLSPGPESGIYFEHALLSRYLGYPLVEGQDLTVRNGRVFLKKLAGLEPVAAIFRHTPDAGSDPLALRQATVTGAAGLIQVTRERNINIVNPIGSGFAETPALSVYLPALSRHLLGEELLLESQPAWWCGTETGRDHVLANLARLSPGSATDRSAHADPVDAAGAIQSAPHAFMAHEPVCPSAVPAWHSTGIQAHYTLLRVFVCATEQGFTVMPGGLAVTAPDKDTLLGEIPERQRSKDIWVVSDQPVEPFSLMGGLHAVASFNRGSDLPSRVADHLLWLGRYLERAEGLIRLLRSIYRRLSGEARPQDVPELPFLLDLLRADNTIPPDQDGGGIPPYRELSAQMEAALFRGDRTGTVAAVLKQVQSAARNVRDRLSLDSWRVINRLDDFGETPDSDPLDLLDDTLFTLSAFSGLAMESMTRGLGWRFMDMGRRVERALNQAGLIHIGLPRVCVESRGALEALLEVFDSIMTYRARYRTAFQLAPALDLLLVDESNPKSLAFQFCQLTEHVEHLPRQNDRLTPSPEERMAMEMLTAVRQVDLAGLQCPVGAAAVKPLQALLNTAEVHLKAFAQQLSDHYLSRVPATSHFSAGGGKLNL